VLGTYFLYSKQVDVLMLLPASSIGLLSAGVLNLNNMRDIESDKLSNKHTLAGYFGSKNAKTYHIVIITLALGLIGIYTSLMANNSMYFVFIAFVPLLFHLNRVRKIQAPKDYDPQLKILALSTFFLAIVFSVCHSLI
jgi:1,4-dihydroxy-2-naphthoate octaprenyltransferase